MIKKLALCGPCGERHEISFEINGCQNEFWVKAVYEGGDLSIQQGAVVADWTAIYDPPNEGWYEGSIDIANEKGRIDIEVPKLRGIGLGSFIMSILITQIHKLRSVPVSTIYLSGEDALTTEARDRRNRFYEKLGVTFAYENNGASGESNPIASKNLQNPGLKLREGWSIEDCSG